MLNVHKKLAIFSVFSVFALITLPAYADVTSVNFEKSFYTTDENFKFVGTQDGKDIVFVIVRDPAGEFKGMLSDPNPDLNAFSVIPRPVSNFFTVNGIYNATAFTDDQKEKDGITIKLEFDGKQVFVVPDFVLQLNSISDKSIEEKKTLTFTPTLTEDVEGVVFSLEKNPPSGATIDPNTGKFVWTPTESQGPVSYIFDIVVTKGALSDRETIKVIVTEKVEQTPEPTPEVKDDSKELGMAPFVDPNKDPQSYVDRYNNEPKYKEWFDKTFPDMTIYEAVGLDEPKEPEVKEPEIGECGPGTKLTNGKCIIVENPKEGGGCLIATAAYGSEMAPQVQFLREIRDNKVMSTESGASFMTGFNEFYYSFSPYVADYERENPLFKEAVKIGITPMLSSLSIMSFADSEEEIVGYGIGVILMNIGMYVAVPAMMFYGIIKVRKAKF